MWYLYTIKWNGIYTANVCGFELKFKEYDGFTYDGFKNFVLRT